MITVSGVSVCQPGGSELYDSRIVEDDHGQRGQMCPDRHYDGAMASEPVTSSPRIRRLQSGKHTFTLLRLIDVHEEERLHEA